MADHDKEEHGSERGPDQTTGPAKITFGQPRLDSCSIELG